MTKQERHMYIVELTYAEIKRQIATEHTGRREFLVLERDRGAFRNYVLGAHFPNRKELRVIDLAFEPFDYDTPVDSAVAEIIRQAKTHLPPGPFVKAIVRYRQIEREGRQTMSEENSCKFPLGMWVVQGEPVVGRYSGPKVLTYYLVCPVCQAVLERCYDTDICGRVAFILPHEWNENLVDPP